MVKKLQSDQVMAGQEHTVKFPSWRGAAKETV